MESPLRMNAREMRTAGHVSAIGCDGVSVKSLSSILGRVMSDAGLEVLIPSPLQEVEDDRLVSHGIRLLLKRDDLIHPDIPGNKWRKLHYHLEAASDKRYRRLLTFDGASSNNIMAIAAA